MCQHSVTILIFFIVVFAFYQESPLFMSTLVRKAFGSGRWFSGDGKALTKEVLGYIESASIPAISGRIVASIAPHAGFRYSGPIAGHTFRAIRDMPKENQPELLIIIGFSHSERISGAALMDGTAITTPCGTSQLDVESGQFLCQQSSEIRFDGRYHNGEHSAENEIPFAQVALPTVPLVVALIGDSGVQPLSKALVELNKRKRLTVVCSTDMLHDENYDKVLATDEKTLKDTENMDIDALQKAWSYQHQIYCGFKPVMCGLYFAKALGCQKAQILKHSCSGDGKPASQRDYNVGYGSAVMTIP
ncbi:AmmeMemoRadiSam system protein B [Blattamonas nauphoetae]|uniref:AmmeMemoRadiSam system protein B n=1 Tax=Blattamonas nauphoetae TaxID=2049346 RepID=A0ABQ9XRF9_9EUKA|nr:AmmeMemoRadiSam system protein B [Blattamonas nauphoetae]